MNEKPCILQWRSSARATAHCHPVATFPDGFYTCDLDDATVFPNTRAAAQEIRRLTSLGCSANGLFLILLISLWEDPSAQ